MGKPLIMLVTVLALVGCGSEEKSKRGVELMPDMLHTPAFKSQTSVSRTDGVDDQGRPVIAEHGMMMLPVAGTVARGVDVYPYAQTDVAAAHALQNPLLPDAHTLRLGQRRFNQTCAACHGRDGDPSKAPMSGRFAGVPGLNTPIVAAMSDGDINHLIAAGRGRMTDFKAQLPTDERWAVVHYVRLLGRAAATKDGAPLSASDQALVRGIDAAAAERFEPEPAPVPAYEQPTWSSAPAHSPDQHP